MTRLKKLAVTAGFLQPLPNESISEAEVNPEANKVDENLYTIQDGIEELKRSITEVIECWNIWYVERYILYSQSTFLIPHSTCCFMYNNFIIHHLSAWKIWMLRFESATVALASSSSVKREDTTRPKSPSPSHQETALSPR